MACSPNALCAGSAYVALAEGKKAETAATRAIAVFAALPDHRRWRSGQMSATVDLATARALQSDLAGAEAALGAIFALPPGERTEAVSLRLQGLGRILGAPRHRTAVEATRMGVAIEEFTSGSLARTTARPAIGPV